MIAKISKHPCTCVPCTGAHIPVGQTPRINVCGIRKGFLVAQLADANLVPLPYLAQCLFFLIKSIQGIFTT